MISLPSGTRIWLVAGVTDMRKSFNGLGELVQHALEENPFSGHEWLVEKSATLSKSPVWVKRSRMP